MRTPAERGRDRRGACPTQKRVRRQKDILIEQGFWIFAEGEQSVFGGFAEKTSVLPDAEPVECGESPIRCGFALTADQFTAPANIFLHPGGKKEMERIT